MSDLFPVFFSRSFGSIPQPGIGLQVERLTWQAIGGCKSARLIASTRGPVDLDQFAALLRCPVIIYSAAGRRVWWGLVWSVRIQDESTSPPIREVRPLGEGGDRVGAWLSLDDLTNRARVIYGKQEPEATASGLRASTAWEDDLNSQAIYGVKEGQYSLELANPSQAETLRSNNLKASSRISPRPVIGLGTSESSIIIDLRGWWETLAWRFYSNSTGVIQHITRNPNYLVPVGDNTSQIMAQQITVPVGGWWVESIWFQLKRVGAPASTLSASLYSDAAGSPGVNLASGALDGTNLSIANPVWLRFLLSSPVAVVAGVYWIAITDNSSKADANYYRVQADRLAGYAGGAAKAYNGAAWSAALAYDLQFKVAGTMETTEQIKLMAGAAFGGQFLAGVRVDQPSAIFTNPQRTGDKTVLDEITAHLEAGGLTGAKYQATITPERHMIVSPRPAASTARLVVRGDGIIRLRGGQIAPPGPDLAGCWAVLDTKWAINSASWLQSPGRVFIERVEWQDGVCRAVSP